MKRNEKKTKLFSVTKLIINLFALSMVLIIGLTTYYSALMIRTSYMNCLTILQKSTENSASAMNEAISTLNKQTEWLSSTARDSAIWYNSSAYEDMLWKNKLTDNMQGFLAANTGIDAIIIAQRNDITFLESHTISEEAFFRLADSCNGLRAITPKSMNVFCENGTDVSHLIFTKAINEYQKYVNSNRIAVNIYTLIRLDSLIPKNNAGEIQLFSLKNEKGYHVLSVQGSTDSDIYEWESSINAAVGNKVLTVHGVRYLQEWMPLDYPDAYILCLQPVDVFLEKMTLPFVIAFALLIGATVLVVIEGRTIIRQIRIPLSDMLSDIACMREKCYSHRLGPGKSIEFRQVTDSFNALLDDLNNQTDVIVNQQKKLYEIQLLQKESQLLSLQSQIKPHFLYNTLECVLSIARYHKIPEIVRIINGMIQIYRYSTVSMQTGTVESEIECARMYADIINTRFENRYQFEFNTDRNLNKCIMPKMILQPLVENAVNHGISKCTRTGKVEIRCTENNGIVNITVWDNGKGVSKRHLSEIIDSLSEDSRKSSSIGLYNISTRLKSEYGPEYGLTVESEEDVYTMVTVFFPKEVKGE